MTEEKFTSLVEEAIAGMPERIRTALDNVGFVIEDRARRARAREVGIRLGDVLLGLYEGIPLVERGDGYVMVAPDKITVFRLPIEREAGGGPDDVRALVHEVVWHEVGHHLGFDDRELRRIERRRKRSGGFRTVCDR